MRLNNTINGKCSGCGNCCSNILLLTEKEINKINKYIKKYKIKPINRNSILNTEYKDVCPFLNNDNKCNIYPIRAKICKTFMCDNSKREDIDYLNVKVVNMIKTFFPKEYCPEIDLSFIEKRIKELQNKLRKEEKL